MKMKTKKYKKIKKTKKIFLPLDVYKSLFKKSK